MATFWEIAAHSFDCMWVYVILVIPRFGFEGWIWVLNASVPGLCIGFYSQEITCSVRKGSLAFIFVLKLNLPVPTSEVELGANT